MKVKKVSRSGPQKSTSTKKSEVPRITFTEILGSLENDRDRSKELLDELLQDIESKGKQLIENRTVETLVEYREMIKGFIEEAVEKGYKIEERRGFSRTGRTRVMRTVKEIDKQLVELTNLILGQEKKQIRLLEKVGQIQGLLVNLII